MTRRSGCLGGGCLAGIVIFVLVPISLGLGWWLLSNVGRVLTHESVDAVVVDLIQTVDSDGDTLYRPVYGFVVDGQDYRYESMVNLGGIVVPDIGDRRTLLYDPGNPSDARVRNYFLLLGLPALLLAVPLIAIAGIVYAGLRRRRKGVAAAEAGGAIPPWAPSTMDAPPGSPLPSLSRPAENYDVIEATFMGTEPSQMDAAGNIRYRVKARAEIDGVVHRFRGDWVDADPTLLFMERGNTVQVRVDRNDPSSYELLMPTFE
jgi:hypothetical protein